MISQIFDKFQHHPSEVGETYWEHFCHALGFALRLFVAAGACLIHAILPFLFTSTGSAMINNLYSRMVQNRSRVVLTGREDSVDRRIIGDIVVNGNSKV
jgi:hypothetical protein